MMTPGGFEPTNHRILSPVPYTSLGTRPRMRTGRVELPRPFDHQSLNLARIPTSPCSLMHSVRVELTRPLGPPAPQAGAATVTPRVQIRTVGVEPTRSQGSPVFETGVATITPRPRDWARLDLNQRCGMPAYEAGAIGQTTQQALSLLGRARTFAHRVGAGSSVHLSYEERDPLPGVEPGSME